MHMFASKLSMTDTRLTESRTRNAALINVSNYRDAFTAVSIHSVCCENVSFLSKNEFFVVRIL